MSSMSSGNQPREAGIARYLQTSSWCSTVAWFWGQVTCFPAGHRMNTSTPFPAAKTSGSLLHLTFHNMVTGNWGQGHLESVTGPAAPVLIVSVRFSQQTPSLVGNHLAAAAGFLPRCAGLAQAPWRRCPLSLQHREPCVTPGVPQLCCDTLLQGRRRRSTDTSWGATASRGSWLCVLWPACLEDRRAAWPLPR